jgi:hypothetical protein
MASVRGLYQISVLPKLLLLAGRPSLNHLNDGTWRILLIHSIKANTVTGATPAGRTQHLSLTGTDADGAVRAVQSRSDPIIRVAQALCVPQADDVTSGQSGGKSSIAGFCTYALCSPREASLMSTMTFCTTWHTGWTE